MYYILENKHKSIQNNLMRIKKTFVASCQDKLERPLNLGGA